MVLTKKTKIGELAALYNEAISVFDAHEIDYYSLGKRSVEGAAIQKELNVGTLLADLNNALKDVQEPSYPFHALSLTEVLNHVDALHEEMHAQIHILTEMLERKPRLLQDEAIYERLKNGFEVFATQLKRHHKIEGEFTLPYFRSVEEARKNNNELVKPFFGNFADHMDIMLLEHEVIAKRFRWVLNTVKFGSQTSRINNPDFERILHGLFPIIKEYIHLENNIVFPRVEKLQNQLKFK